MSHTFRLRKYETISFRIKKLFDKLLPFGKTHRPKTLFISHKIRISWLSTKRFSIFFLTAWQWKQSIEQSASSAEPVSLQLELNSDYHDYDSDSDYDYVASKNQPLETEAVLNKAHGYGVVVRDLDSGI